MIEKHMTLQFVAPHLVLSRVFEALEHLLALRAQAPACGASRRRQEYPQLQRPSTRNLPKDCARVEIGVGALFVGSALAPFHRALRVEAGAALPPQMFRQWH